MERPTDNKLMVECDLNRLLITKRLLALYLTIYLNLFQMTENGLNAAEVDEATLLQDPDYKALVDYGINKTVAAELKKTYDTGMHIAVGK